MMFEPIEYLNEILKSYNINYPDYKQLFNYIVAFETKTVYYDMTDHNSITHIKKDDPRFYQNFIYHNIRHITHYDGNKRFVYTIDLTQNIDRLGAPKTDYNEEIIELLAIDSLQRDMINSYEFLIYIYYEDSKLNNLWIRNTMELMQNIPSSAFHYISKTVIKEYPRQLMMRLYNTCLTHNNHNIVNIVDFDNLHTLEIFGYYLCDGIEKNTLKELITEYITNNNNNYLTDEEIKNKVDNIYNYIINIQQASPPDNKLLTLLKGQTYYINDNTTIILRNPFNYSSSLYGGIIKINLPEDEYKSLETDIKLHSVINDKAQFICYISDEHIKKYIKDNNK